MMLHNNNNYCTVLVVVHNHYNTTGSSNNKLTTVRLNNDGSLLECVHAYGSAHVNSESMQCMHKQRAYITIYIKNFCMMLYDQKCRYYVESTHQ